MTSASKLDITYRTDGGQCTCAAALVDAPIGQYRAVARYGMG